MISLIGAIIVGSAFEASRSFCSTMVVKVAASSENTAINKGRSSFGKHFAIPQEIAVIKVTSSHEFINTPKWIEGCESMLFTSLVLSAVYDANLVLYHLQNKKKSIH